MATSETPDFAFYLVATPLVKIQRTATVESLFLDGPEPSPRTIYPIRQLGGRPGAGVWSLNLKRRKFLIHADLYNGWGSHAMEDVM